MRRGFAALSRQPYENLLTLNGPASSGQRTGPCRLDRVFVGPCFRGLTHLSRSAFNGYWYCDQPSSLLIDSITGKATALAVDTVLITNIIRNSSGCASTSKIYYIVNAPGSKIATIDSIPPICKGEAIYLLSNLNGGSWYSNNTSIATIDRPSGYLRAITAGIVRICYVPDNLGSCSDTAFRDIEITPRAEPVIQTNGLKLSTTLPYDSYAWYKNDVPISFETGSSYTVTAPGFYKVYVSKANECSAFSAEVFIESLSVNEVNNENTNDNTIILYPNPANTTITVNTRIDNKNSQAAISYTITDLSGKVLIAGSITHSKTTIDLHSLAQGVYLFRTKAGVLRFVKITSIAD